MLNIWVEEASIDKLSFSSVSEMRFSTFFTNPIEPVFSARRLAVPDALPPLVIDDDVGPTLAELLGESSPGLSPTLEVFGST